MLQTDQELLLCAALRDLPRAFDNRFTSEASQALQHILFESLVNHNRNYLDVLFNGKLPGEDEDWILREAQGAVDGSEYTEAARGKACGHIFKNGEATYRCRTCTTEDTCVLCSKCFEASDHAGHMVFINISPGNSGCCDCGDAESWRLPVNCAIHTAHSTSLDHKEDVPMLPEDLKESLRMTIGRAFDYICDVISCSPEQLRRDKSIETIREDEGASRLTSVWYGAGDEIEKNPEYALILWNDEKHTVHEVQNQVNRACRREYSFGKLKAGETDDIGRSVVHFSRDPQELLDIASTIENIKLTVTIRSARDTFREQMCSTIIEWLLDVARCSVDNDHDILKQTVCQEMLKNWRTGSEASNAEVGRDGIDDHDIDDVNEQRTRIAGQRRDGVVNGEFIRVLAVTREIDQNIINARTGDEDNNDEDGDDEADDQTLDGDPPDLMELDPDLGSSDPDGDLDMRGSGEAEDTLEASEATFAGYPPPPPPPPPALAPAPEFASLHAQADAASTSGITDHYLVSNQTTPKAIMEVPKTPHSHARRFSLKPPDYWLAQGRLHHEDIPLSEDVRQRVRLDWMILFDLRLWKKARVDLRDLYISTVVTVPEFKRVLGLRFAGLYTVLAQLYLIADREPDHSIIYLSLQMLTTPSITEEIVEKGNFLTKLIAILYTFLTTRQVGHPQDVSTAATLAFDVGSVNNRRMYHFFMDLRHLFASEYVQDRLRNEERYVLQFLDLIKLPQGICPNTRAVGEHVEYETDAWISASLLTREINKLCRQFAESFRWRIGEDTTNISRVLQQIAKATVINSVGAERKRFDGAEVREEMKFKFMSNSDYAVNFALPGEVAPEGQCQVVEFIVEEEPISFHHALHYTLSWLIDGAKSMTATHIRTLLEFRHRDLRESTIDNGFIPDLDPETYLIALFDYPLRVCSWLAQMKAGMWVRNGLSLRHQMSTYRGVSQRDLAHHRDIFLLQTAMVICNPNRILLSMIDRFGMNDWMCGTYVVRKGYEDNQLLDVAEDFIHLIIVLLSDRTSLHPFEDEPSPQALAIRRDITHILCFKPLSFSDLCTRLADKFQDLEEFQDILEEMTNYKAPEGLSDTGTFELKPDFLSEIDPYIAHYTKNQRDEAETAYRTWMSKKTGKPISEIVFEPKFRPVRSGIFEDLSVFTRTPVFSQIVYHSLCYALQSTNVSSNIPNTRVEAFLQVVLHLVLAAVLEDHSREGNMGSRPSESFVYRLLHCGPQTGASIFTLQKLSEIEVFKACHAKINLILLRAKQRYPRSYASLAAARGLPMERLGSDSPMRLPDEDLEAKKKQQALDRQARVMAQFQQQQQDFMTKQGNLDWGEEEEDDEDDVASVMTGNTDEYKHTWKYPMGNCILCQEETNDARLFGTFALLTDSNILRQTDMEDSDYIGEVIHTPLSLDKSAEAIRPFGVAGQNREKVVKLASDLHEVISERQGLGKGFPSSRSLRGPVSTGCGHIMHYSCFELYCNATLRRQNHQIARNHPEKIEHKEFVCPLCKALGNTFLPIIWKGKEEVYPGVLQTDSSFEKWLGMNIGLTVSRFHKQPVGEEKKLVSVRHQELFVGYTSKAMIAPLAAKLSKLIMQDRNSPTSPQYSGRSHIPSSFSDDDGSHFLPTHPVSIESPAMDELSVIYSRIRETIKKNELVSRFTYPPTKQSNANEDLTYSDALARALGFSISAVEIAQRGVESEPGSLLLDRISPLTLTHLRILSETASSYLAIGSLRNSGNNRTNQEFFESHSRQLLQLFAGHPHIYGNDELPNFKTSQVPAALSQDPFILLTECSIYLVPAMHLDIHHIIRLCYLLELVKVTLAIYCKPGVPTNWPNIQIPAEKLNVNLGTLMAFRGFLSKIRNFGDPTGSSTNLSAAPVELLQQFYALVLTYALPFLRKVAILFNVRYGVDFPSSGLSDIDDTEIDRLTRALRLPTLTEMFSSLGQTNNGSNLTILQSVVAGWTNHWRVMLEASSLQSGALSSIRPSHPAIFELIGLPKCYDTLLDEMMRRRCPTTGKELVEPALCLFCGDIFCSQAVCCTKKGLGGCNQHLQKCGGNIGLFINIRKCWVLYLHSNHGSWTHAPYLDKHGEVDPGLRRARQLYLNPKRYDALLRNVWLQHGIPTTISRKLEADINNGGWETL